MICKNIQKGDDGWIYFEVDKYFHFHRKDLWLSVIEEILFEPKYGVELVTVKPDVCTNVYRVKALNPIDWSTVAPPELTPAPNPHKCEPRIHVHVDRPRGFGWFR